MADFLVRENLVFAGEAKKIGSHFPLGDRQARLSGVECGNIDAVRQNPRWSAALAVASFFVAEPLDLYYAPTGRAEGYIIGAKPSR